MGKTTTPGSLSLLSLPAPPSLTLSLPSFHFSRSETRNYGGALAVGPFKRSDGRTLFQRAVINGVLLESQAYTRNSLRNNFCVSTRSHGLALISSYFIQDEKIFALILPLEKGNHMAGAPRVIPMMLAPAAPIPIPSTEILKGPLPLFKKGESYIHVDLPFTHEGS